MESRPYETDESAAVGNRPLCPQCESIELRRQGRFGFWQRVVLSRFGLFPWECGLCRKIYMLPQRSANEMPEASGQLSGMTPLNFVLASPVVGPMLRKKMAR